MDFTLMEIQTSFTTFCTTMRTLFLWSEWSDILSNINCVIFYTLQMRDTESPMNWTESCLGPPQMGLCSVCNLQINPPENIDVLSWCVPACVRCKKNVFMELQRGARTIQDRHNAWLII